MLMTEEEQQMQDSGDPYRNALPDSAPVAAPAANQTEAVGARPTTGGAATAGARQGRRRGARPQETAQQLAKLWALPQDADDAAAAYMRDLGAERLLAISEAVRPLPWSILKPLGALPAWPIERGAVSTPLTMAPDEAETRIRHLPEELARWRRMNACLGEVWATAYGLFQERADAGWRGAKAELFLTDDLLDHLEIVRKVVMERLAYLESWAAGTRPGRLTGQGKADGKAQNLVLVRHVAVELAVRISRALTPASRGDRRLLHGVLRAAVRQRMTALMHLIYGVTFSETEARDMLRKYVKEAHKGRK
jgi:hypothetical protein